MNASYPSPASQRPSPSTPTWEDTTPAFWMTDISLPAPVSESHVRAVCRRLGFCKPTWHPTAMSWVWAVRTRDAHGAEHVETISATQTGLYTLRVLSEWNATAARPGSGRKEPRAKHFASALLELLSSQGAARI